MKKIIYILFLMAFFTMSQFSNAQVIADLNKAKTTSDADIQDPKKNIKPATWQKRGDVYRDIANDKTGVYAKLDPNAIFVSYEAYLKAKELGSKTADKSIKDMYGAVINVGAGSYGAKDFDKSYKVFELGQKIAPDSLVPFLYASEVALELSNEANYSKDIENSLKFPSKSFEANNLKKADFIIKYGIFNIEKEKYDKALEVLNKGISEFPEDTELKKLQAECLIRTGKLEDAIKQYENLIAKDPNSPDNYYNLGIIYEKADNRVKAEESYNKALEKDPASFNARYNLGAMYYNKAVIIVKEVAAMDIKTYQKEGAAKEKEALALFTQAQPHFEKLYAKTDLKPDQRYQVLTALQGIYNNLKKKDELEKVNKELAEIRGDKDED